jgi:hypothetical protein
MEHTTYAGYPVLQVADRGRLLELPLLLCLRLDWSRRPMSQLISASALQQQARQIKKPSAGQRAARARQKKHRTEWNKAKDPGKIEKRTENFGALAIIVSSQLPNSTHQNFSNAQTISNANSENTEGVGET